MNTQKQIPHTQIIQSEQQIDDITGALILVGYLYYKGLINKETYDAIQEKYKNKSNKTVER